MSLAESKLTIIKNAKKRIIQAQKDIVTSLGNYIWTHYKVPTTNANGDIVKYKNGNIKPRKVGGVKEFKTHFSVVKRPKSICKAEYLVWIGLESMKLFDDTGAADYRYVLRRMKHAKSLLPKDSSNSNSSNNNSGNKNNDDNNPHGNNDDNSENNQNNEDE